MKRTTIMLTDELSEEIQIRSRICRKPASEIIRSLLEKGIEAELSTPRELPFASLGEAREPFDASKMDEFLEETWGDEIQKGWRP